MIFLLCFRHIRQVLGILNIKLDIPSVVTVGLSLLQVAYFMAAIIKKAVRSSENLTFVDVKTRKLHV